VWSRGLWAGSGSIKCGQSSGINIVSIGLVFDIILLTCISLRGVVARFVGGIAVKCEQSNGVNIVSIGCLVFEICVVTRFVGGVG
jgi:hypothetical protein